MWLLYAFASSFFAGITAILAKVGMKKINSSLAMALRTIIVLIFSWLMVFITATQIDFAKISMNILVFLILSGLSTGASWLCYFKALQLGDVNQVTPIDKSSTIMTMILAIVFFHESLTFLKMICILFIGIGTYLMIEKKANNHENIDNRWFFYALGSAVFASMTAILAKIGIKNIDSTLATAIRTIVVLMMAWMIVFMQKKQEQIKAINCKSWIYLILSGITTGLSWLCYYRALQDGLASVVVPIDKLSIVFTVMFSYFVLKEKLSFRAGIGLMVLVMGTLLLLIS